MGVSPKRLHSSSLVFVFLEVVRKTICHLEFQDCASFLRTCKPHFQFNAGSTPQYVPDVNNCPCNYSLVEIMQISVSSLTKTPNAFISVTVCFDFCGKKLNVGGGITLSPACTLWGNDSANIVSSCHFCSSLSYAGFLDGKLCQHSLSLCGLLNFNWTSAGCDSTSWIREFTRTCSNGKRITQISISYVSCDWDLFLAVSLQLSLKVNLCFFFHFGALQFVTLIFFLSV